ncbi:hypothetical protein EV360DRAFT_89503 [Lentinula raphanica]|nr:hypothetical protein EV360DRAFT_89503 [Lentinula raphanica]
MSTLTPQGTSQIAAPPEPPQTGAPSPPEPPQTGAPSPPEPPQTAAHSESPQASAPSESPQTAAPSESPQTATPSESPLTAATAETPLPAHTAHSKSKSRKKGRSKKKARVAHSSGSEMDTSDEDVSEERKPGRKSSLTQHQQGLVRARFSEWEQVLLTLWVEKAINEITTSPTFGHFNDTSKELSKILKAMFRNYRNNTFIKKNKHAFVQKAFGKKQASLDSADADLPEGDALKADALKAAEALASFKNPAPAKAIFREENDEKIKEEAERLRAEAAQQRAAEGRDPEDFNSHKDDNRGGFYQRALSALWKEADQTLCEEKANSFDLYTNQEEFPKVIRTALEALCQHGAVGPMEIFFMSGFRNANNEVTLCRKEDIRKCLASRRRLQALELSTGDDIVSYDTIHAQLTPSDHLVSLLTFNPLQSTVNELPAANNNHQTETVRSPNTEACGVPSSSAVLTPPPVLTPSPVLTQSPVPTRSSVSTPSSVPVPATAPTLSSVMIPATAPTLSSVPISNTAPTLSPAPLSTKPTRSGEPMPSTVSDIMPVLDPMDTTPQDIPLVSTNSVAPVLSDNAVPAGQICSPSSIVAPASTLQHAPPDADVDPNSPNSLNSTSTQNLQSSVVITLPDAAIPDSPNIAPPVAVSAAVNMSLEPQPTRQGRRGARKKASKGSTPGSSHPVDATAVLTEVRRSSRGKAGKRANPVPDLGQRPAKKPKHHKGYANIVPQPNGRLALVHVDGTISGYVIKDSDGKEIEVDENGQYVGPLFGNAK